MDDLLSDAALQILARTETKTLALLLPQFPEEVRARINSPVFWQIRLAHRWPDELQDLENFKKIFSATKPVIDLELVARLVEYCELKNCHVIVAALALHNFPSLEVIKAALALVLGPTPGQALDPDEEEGEALALAALECCRHDPQHLGRVLSYLWLYELTSEKNLRILLPGLAEDLDNFSLALDTMSECLAWHAQMRLLSWLLWQAVQEGHVALTSFLVAYALRQHYYEVLQGLYGDSRHLHWARRLLTQELETQSPELLYFFKNNAYIPEDLKIAYAWPPGRRVFPFPLIDDRSPNPERPSLSELYLVGKVSVFAYNASQLVELWLEDVDVAELLHKEVQGGFPYHPQEVEYSSFVVLHRLAPEGFPVASINTWVEANQERWETAQLVLYFLDQLWSET